MKNDRPIRAGDLVIVVRNKTCCGKGRAGFIFEVEEVSSEIKGVCQDCGEKSIRPAAKVKGESRFWIDLHLLKRIPPLGELSRISRDEEITA